MTPTALLLPLHLGAAALLLATLAVPRLRPRARPAGILLVASVFLLLKLGGGWVDMPTKFTIASLLLLLPWAGLCWWSNAPARLLAGVARSLAAAGGFLYAGFFLVLGVQSLRNGVPLPPAPALQAILLGLLLPLLAMAHSRLAAGVALLLGVLLLATLLLASAFPGVAIP